MTALGDRGDLVCCSTQCPACHRIVLCDGVGARVDRIHHHDCTGPGRQRPLMLEPLNGKSEDEIHRRIEAREWIARGCPTYYRESQRQRVFPLYDIGQMRLRYGEGRAAVRRGIYHPGWSEARKRWPQVVEASVFSWADLAL